MSHTLISRSGADRVRRNRKKLTGEAISIVIGLGDAVAIVVMAAITGVTYHEIVYSSAGDVLSFLRVGAVLAAVVVISNLFRGEYQLSNFLRLTPHARRTAQLWNVTFVCLLIVGFVGKVTDFYSRGWFVLYYVSGLLTLLALRYIAVQLVHRSAVAQLIATKRVFLIGNAGEIERFLAAYEPRRGGIEIIGCRFLSETALSGTPTARQKALQRELVGILPSIRQVEPDAIFIITSWSDQAVIDGCIESLLTLPTEIHLGPGHASRKLLIMEDGHTSNLALWLDPSVHYWAPTERVESLEVIRGTIITHGPNNNFGVINARALSPFGPEETVVSAGVGFTDLKGGCYEGNCKDGEWRESYRWHIHTRQHADNVGLVLSYTGADQQGSWDTERLRFNDFHGALGWKGIDDDLVVSLTYVRQRDNYDEQNVLQEFDEPNPFAAGQGLSEDEAIAAFGAFHQGAAERAFSQLGHMKSLYAPGSILNTYVGDVWRGQIVHNAYLDDDTTVTSRVYAGQHTRDRYQTITPESFPDGTLGEAPVPFGAPQEGYYFGEDTMFGRLRTFRHLGGELRTEWANRNLLGFNQDIQAGIRYEYQDMTNRNFLGLDDQILGEGDSAGATLFDRSLSANTVSAFLQTNIAVASDFNVLPGIRFEWYNISRTNRVIAEEESEAGEEDPCPDPTFPGECLEIEGINFNPDRHKENYSNFNALPGIAFAYTGLYRSTLYGGYHRGMSTGVLRNDDFPAPDELGDNFNLGFRSSAIKGFDYEVAGFYQLIQDYQFGSSFSDAGDRSYGRANEVESAVSNFTGVSIRNRSPAVRSTSSPRAITPMPAVSSPTRLNSTNSET